MIGNKKCIPCKKIPVLLVFLFFAAYICSCATDLSSRASRVRLVSVEHVQIVERECDFLGNVLGKSFPTGGCLSWFKVGERVAYNNALNELLDNASELGATHVFVNLGSYHDLRGESYLCSYCRMPDGSRDAAFCLSPLGEPDIDYCMDDKGNIVGEAYCEGADATSQRECLKNGGNWKKGINKTECENRNATWYPAATDRAACKAKGGTWYPEAKEEVTCEAKGGKWTVNQEVLRFIPSDTSGYEQ